MILDRQGRTWALKMGRSEPEGTSQSVICASEASTASEFAGTRGHEMGWDKFEGTRSSPDEQLLQKTRVEEVEHVDRGPNLDFPVKAVKKDLRHSASGRSITAGLCS